MRIKVLAGVPPAIRGGATYRVVGSEIASERSSKSSTDSRTASSYKLKLLRA